MVLGQIDLLQLGVPFTVYLNEREKFVLELKANSNTELFKDDDVIQGKLTEYFRIGEDSSLIILPPEEDFH